MRFVRWLFSFAAVITAPLAAQSSCHEKQVEGSFVQKILESVHSCIEHNKDQWPQEEMCALLEELAIHSKATQTGCDDLRVKFVTMQGCIEHVLACAQSLGDVDQLVGVIHTPMPATPLCARPQADVSGLLDASIRQDQKKMNTVLARALILREYLRKGGRLYIAYPRGGYEKRNLEQQQIYQETVQQFPDHLIDCVLAVDEIPADMVGATYLFSNSDHQLFAFSIQSSQANDIQAMSNWGLWFGPIEHPEVADRVNKILNYLSRFGELDLRGRPFHVPSTDNTSYQ